MKIPFVDLKAQYLTIKRQIDDAMAAVINDCAFIRGAYVEEFERNFAEYCGAGHCLGVANGTDALIVALKALGIGSGDQVIVPANSFIATSEAVSALGAQVVFADCKADYTLDVEDVERKISSRTKAVIPVHLYGNPADMESFCLLRDKYDLKIVQDCAQAHGAKISGRQLSEYGDILCYSFYPGKNLGAYGDAGAVVTNDPALLKKCAMYSNHGRIAKYDHEFEGVNSRMDGIQGAVLNVKLKHLESWTDMRIAAAAFYHEKLAGTGDIILPPLNKNNRHVFHLYVIQCGGRDKLKEYLSSKQISCGIHYPKALPFLSAYKYLGHKPGDFPNTEKFQSRILSLPMFPELSENQIDFCVDAIKTFFK